METAARLVIVLAALWLTGVAALMLFRPQLALTGLSRMASTALINYGELSLRGLWGVSLIVVAGSSRLPGFLAALGWFLAASSVVLMLIPRRWHAAYAVYWARRMTPGRVRWLSPFSVLFAALMLWAIW